jgi:diacylglycerol kinase (ATP)
MGSGSFYRQLNTCNGSGVDLKMSPTPFLEKVSVKPGLTGVARLVAASRNSLRGIRDGCRFEAAFRQELALAAVLLPLSFWLAQTLVEWLLLVMPLFLLLMVELLNSAIENTVDRIGDEHHELSGRAKDMASAAIMICLLLVAVAWLGVAWERFCA